MGSMSTSPSLVWTAKELTSCFHSACHAVQRRSPGAICSAATEPILLGRAAPDKRRSCCPAETHRVRGAKTAAPGGILGEEPTFAGGAARPDARREPEQLLLSPSTCPEEGRPPSASPPRR